MATHRGDGPNPTTTGGALSNPPLSGAGGGPVLFLVREHAKVLLSLQELQEKVAELDELRSVVKELGENTMSLRNVSLPVSWSKQRHLKSSPEPHLINIASGSQVAPAKRDPESDKQDSGLESDCRDPRSSGHCDARSPSYLPNNLQRSSHLSKMEDELLNLLECIEERSHTLRDQVVRMEHESLNMYSRLDDDVRMENQRLKQRVAIVEANLEKSLRKLQGQLHRLAGEKLALEDRLQTSQFEKLQLENHVRELHLSCVRGLSDNPIHTDGPETKKDNFPVGAEGGGSYDGQILNRLRLDHQSELSDEVRAKVTEIVRNGNSIDLQQQLAHYVMENDTLRKKLEHLERTWFERLQDWKTNQTSMKSDIEHLILERDSYMGALKKSHQENRMLRSRLKMYGNTLGGDNVLDHTESAPGEAGNFSVYFAQQRVPQTFHGGYIDNYNDSFHRANSLPPLFVNQAQNAHFEHTSLIDSPNQEITGPASLYADVDDLASCTSSSSDRVVYRAPWQQRVQTEHRLMNLEDPPDDKMSQHSSEMNDICNEFDPLMSSDLAKPDGNHDANKPMDFVDSLDLSVPLAPSKTHLDNMSVSSNNSRLTKRTLSTTRLDSAHHAYAAAPLKSSSHLFRTSRVYGDA